MPLKTESLGIVGRVLLLVGIWTAMTGNSLALTGEMVSLRSDGSLPGSIQVMDKMPALTPDGRYVAFVASATDLVTPSASGYQIYLRDRVLGTMELVSADNAGTPGNNSSSESPSISADGCKVVFSSYASNLVPGDTNGTTDVFVRDRCSTPPQTSAVSVNSSGALGNGGSAEPRISANGRYVIFSSYTSNLVPPYGYSTWNTLYVRDLQTATTSVLGTYTDPSYGLQAIAGGQPDISADGMRVVFFAYGRPESPSLWQIYSYDRNTSTLAMVSTDAAGTAQAQVGGASTVAAPAISGDGLWATFASPSKTLVPGVIDGNRHVYVKNLTTGAIEVADVASDGTLGNYYSSGYGSGERPSISYDGTWITFSTSSTNLFPNAPSQSVVLRNIHLRETIGLTPNSTSALPAISSDAAGRFVSFYSQSYLDTRFNARGYFLVGNTSNWTALPGASPSRSSLALNSGTGKTQMVVRSASDQLWMGNFNTSGAFEGWNQLPGASPSPVAQAWHPGVNKMYMVARAANDQLYLGTFNSAGSFESWSALPGASPSPVALAWHSTLNKMYMVARAANDQLYLGTFNSAGSFEGWNALPGTSPSLVALAWHPTLNKMYMVARAANDQLYLGTFNAAGSFEGWNALPGASPSPVALAWHPTLNKMYLVVRSTSEQLWQGTFSSASGAFEGFSALSGNSPTAPVLAAGQSNLQLVVRSANDWLWSMLLQ